MSLWRHEHAVMVNLDFLVVWMAAHGAVVLGLAHVVVGLTVKLFKVLQAARVEHVRTVKQRRLLVVYERIEAYWTVFVATLQRLVLYILPEIIQLGSISLGLAHGKRLLLLLI